MDDLSGNRERVERVAKRLGLAVPAPDSDPVAECANALGVSPLACKVFCAAGMPGPLDYSPVATSEEAAGQLLGVSGRTVATWKARGMPWAEGCYRIHEIRNWLRKQSWSDLPTQRELDREKVVAIFTVVGCAIVQALNAEFDLGHKVSLPLAQALRELILDDDELRQIAEDILP